MRGENQPHLLTFTKSLLPRTCISYPASSAQLREGRDSGRTWGLSELVAILGSVQLCVHVAQKILRKYYHPNQIVVLYFIYISL